MPLGIDDDLAFAGVKSPAAPVTGDWHNYFEQAAQDLQDKFNFPVEYSRRQMGQESGGNRKAKSFAGAQGLLQLMPGTAKRYGVKDPTDPIQNINGWKSYMTDLLTQFNGDAKSTLAAYNAGEGRVKKLGYERTRKLSNLPKGDPRRGGYVGSTGAYVDKITGLEDIDALTKQLEGVNKPQPKAAPKKLPSGNEDLEFAMQGVPTASANRASRPSYGAAMQQARRQLNAGGATGGAEGIRPSPSSPDLPVSRPNSLVDYLKKIPTPIASIIGSPAYGLADAIGGHEGTWAEGVAGAVSGTIGRAATLAEIAPHDPFGTWITPKNNPLRTVQHNIEQGTQTSIAQHAPQGAMDSFRQAAGRGMAAMPIELSKLLAGGEALGAANLPLQGALGRGEQGPKGLVIGAAEGALFHFGGQVTAPLGKLGSFLVWTAGPTALGVGEERAENAISGTPNRPLSQQIGEHLGANLPFGAFAAAGAQKVWIVDENTGKPRPAKVTDLVKIQRNPDMVIPPTYLADLVHSTRNAGAGPEIAQPEGMLGREGQPGRAKHLEAAEALKGKRESKLGQNAPKGLEEQIKADLTSQLSRFEMKVVEKAHEQMSPEDRVFGLLNVKKQLAEGAKPSDLRFRTPDATQEIEPISGTRAKGETEPLGKDYASPAFHGSPHDFKAELEYEYTDPDTGKVERGFMSKDMWDQWMERNADVPEAGRSFKIIRELPHGRFSSDKIGTGEGNQSYGYGLYFSSAKEVAQHYKNNLSNQTGPYVRGEIKIDPWDTATLLRAAINDGFDPNRSAAQPNLNIKELDQFLRDHGWKHDINRGKLYHVELAPEEHEYLDWDKPLSEQSDHVKEALKKDYPHYAQVDKGREIYQSAPNGFDGELRSKELHKVGIRGIRYATGATRNKTGEKQYNYVIFDDKDVDITDKELKNPFARHEVSDEPVHMEAPTSTLAYLKEQAPEGRIPEGFGAEHLKQFNAARRAQILVSDKPHVETYVAYTVDPSIPNTFGGVRLIDPEFDISRDDLEGIAKAPETQKLTAKLSDIFSRVVADLSGTDYNASHEDMQQAFDYRTRDFGGLSIGSRQFFALNMHPANFTNGRGRIIIDAHNYLAAIHGLHTVGEISGENYSKAWARILVQTMYHELLHNVVETNAAGDMPNEGEQTSVEGHGPEFDAAYADLLVKHAPRVIEYANELQQLLEENNEQITNAFGQQALEHGLIERYERSARGGLPEYLGKKQRLATTAVLSGVGESERAGRNEAAGTLPLSERPNALESSYPLYQRYDFADPDQRARFARKLEHFMGEKSIFKKEDGTYQEVFHATSRDFTTFKQGDIGIHVGTEMAANDALGGMGRVVAKGRGYARVVSGKEIMGLRPLQEGETLEPVDKRSKVQVLPLYAKLENPMRLNDIGHFTAMGMLQAAESHGFISKGEADDVRGKYALGNPKGRLEAVRQLLESKGYDGVVYTNSFEDRGKDSYIVFRPEQLKSAIGNSGEFMADSPNILRSSDPVSVAVKSVIEGGKALYQAGKSFIEWSKGMVDHFGPGIKLHLNNIWEQVHRSLKGFNQDQSGAVSPTLLTLGADKFVQQDIAPAVKAATVGLMQSVDTIQKVFAPAARGPEARTMAGILREGGARLWLKYSQAEKAVNDYRDVMLKLPEATQWQLMADTENGKAVTIPELQPAFDLMRRMNDENLALIQRHGKLSTFIDNYMGHLFENPEEASSILQQLYSKKPLAGKKGILRTRAYRTDIVQAMKDSAAIGKPLRPMKGAENPIDMFLLKFHESRKFIMAMDAMRELKGTGMAKFVRPQDMQDAYNKGLREINDSVATVYGGGAAKPQGGTLIRGKYMVPEAAAQVINNHLSPGLGGNAIFRGFRTMANTLNQLQLGWSAFHAGFTTIDAAVSKWALGQQQLVSGIRNLDPSMLSKSVGSFLQAGTFAPAVASNIVRGRRLQQEALNPGTQPVYRDLVDALTAGGVRFKQEHIYTTDAVHNMKAAFAKGNVWGGLLRTPGASAEFTSAWIMKYLVPWQKLGVAGDLARFELDRNPNGLGRNEMRATMGAVVDSVDNRLGQMTYDNLFWNKTAKDLAMISIRSVGWNVGTFREVGGGIYDFAKQPVKMAAGGKPEFTSRMSYVVALPLYLAMIGAITQYLYTGKGPEELKDYFAPRTGRLDERGNPERIMYPTYLKTAYGLRDAYKFGRNTRKTLVNKANPGLSIVGDMLMNEDFYGTEIANQDDPVVQQLLDYAKYAGRTAMPFSVQNYMKEKERGASTSGAVLPALTGITPAPSDVNQTPAEEELYWYNQDHRPAGTRNKYEAQRSTMMVNIRRALLKGDATKATQLTQQGLNEKTITPNDLGTVVEQLQKTPMQSRFADVQDPGDAIRIWKLMKPSEKSEVQALMMKKLAKVAELPESRQQQLYPKMTEVMKFYSAQGAPR